MTNAKVSVTRGNRIKKTTGSIIFDTFNYLFMILLAAVTLYPLWHVAMASISAPTAYMYHMGPIFYPLGKITFASYAKVLQNPMIPLGYRNTIYYVLLGTAINMLMTMLCAFVLSRKDIMLKGPMTGLIIFTMYFHGGMIPTFLLVKDLKMLDTVWALLLPGAISTFNMIITRTAFSNIPASLEESAELDGANDMVILFRIILPLSLPTLAVILLYYAVGHWNSWFSAMIYLSTREKYPLQLILREILLANTEDASGAQNAVADDTIPISETIKYSTIMVATIPILLVYPFLQKYFVKGVMIGAIKG
ncbi:MAG: carbohydrate ABC transporter permease [Clostridia bacterium]|nr:carbohydrate ABC transporter permease [Clostridia bacterium]